MQAKNDGSWKQQNLTVKRKGPDPILSSIDRQSLDMKPTKVTKSKCQMNFLKWRKSLNR